MATAGRGADLADSSFPERVVVLLLSVRGVRLVARLDLRLRPEALDASSEPEYFLGRGMRGRVPSRDRRVWVDPMDGALSCRNNDGADLRVLRVQWGDAPLP